MQSLPSKASVVIQNFLSIPKLSENQRRHGPTSEPVADYIYNASTGAIWKLHLSSVTKQMQ
jgi:hypothetical protein